MTPPRGGSDAGKSEKRLRRRVEVVNRRGLHARAAAKFVKTAEQFQAQIEVVKDDLRVSGISIMGLMMLAAATGSTLEILARGREARPALAALVALVQNGFDED
jgi:phosphocarrier protein HPr